MYWHALNNNTPLANAIDDIISSKYNDLIEEEQSYTNFVRICNDAGKEVLPKKPAADKLENTAPVTVARNEVLKSKVKDLTKKQKNLKETYNQIEEERIESVIRKFGFNHYVDLREAWNLVKELSGKRSKSPIFIEADDRLEAWKVHFQKLLNADNNNMNL